MKKSVFISFFTVVLFCNIALANTFDVRDEAALLNIGTSVAEPLGKDITDATNTTFAKGDFEQVACLTELQGIVSDIIGQINSLEDLVSLSAEMVNGKDEVNVNSTLKRNISSTLKSFSIDRTHATHQAALCSNSALVNGYTQKTISLIDHVKTLMQSLADQVHTP